MQQSECTAYSVSIIGAARVREEGRERNRNRNRNRGLSGPRSSMTSLAQLSNSIYSVPLLLMMDDGFL